MDAAKAEEPERDAAMSLVIECYQTLASMRPTVPFGLGGSYRGETPWGSMADWCDRHDLDADDLDLIAAVIRQLDGDRIERAINNLTSQG